MRQKTDGLTKKQREVLDFIKKFHAENKYPPSIRQICSAINLSSPATVHVHINHLVEKGFIKRSAEGNKALELLVENEYDTKSEEVINVPIIKNENDESINEDKTLSKEFFPLPSYLVPEEKEVFVVRNSDEGMINKGIILGDIIIAIKNDIIKNNDMVVTLNENNDTVIRTFYKEKKLIKLKPENDNKDIFNLENKPILGKVIGLYRKF